MTEMQRTPGLVAERLIEAAGTMKRLPDVRVQDYFNSWPAIRREFSDRVGEAPTPQCRLSPTPEAITCMEEALQWLRWLEPDDARLVWMRAEGVRWKPVCWRFGLSRATAYRRWEYALSLIAWRLSGRRPPSKRSRAFVVERARTLSR